MLSNASNDGRLTLHQLGKWSVVRLEACDVTFGSVNQVHTCRMGRGLPKTSTLDASWAFHPVFLGNMEYLQKGTTYTHLKLTPHFHAISSHSRMVAPRTVLCSPS